MFSLAENHQNYIKFSENHRNASKFIFPMHTFSYPELFLRAVNGARRGALAKSISNWHLIGYNEGYCSNNVYIFTMFLWFPVLDLARAPRRTARKKGSGYENVVPGYLPSRENMQNGFILHFHVFVKYTEKNSYYIILIWKIQEKKLFDSLDNNLQLRVTESLGEL
jgi:hypothetical protein